MKIKRSYKVEDLHELYMNDPLRRGHIPPGAFTKMFIEITELHLKEIIEERGLWRLPNMMGVLGLRKINVMPLIAAGKHLKSAVDHKTSKVIKKTAYYLNLHTGGYAFGIQWKRNKNYQRFSNHTLYDLKIGPATGAMIEDVVLRTTRNMFKKSIDAPLKLTL